jgi:hypothetical protein
MLVTRKPLEALPLGRYRVVIVIESPRGANRAMASALSAMLWDRACASPSYGPGIAPAAAPAVTATAATGTRGR